MADLGGGTSDFSIIRLSKRYATKPDRSSDILASTGIRLGGNDLDKALSLAAIMPELGYRKDGLSYAAIADRLNGMGFRTRQGSLFLAMSVQRLDNG